MLKREKLSKLLEQLMSLIDQTCKNFELPVKHKIKIEENFQNKMGLKNETGYLTF